MDRALGEAVAHYRAGRLEAAARVCEGLLGAVTRPVNALALLGLIRARQGRREEAAGHLAEAAGRSPGSAELRINLGNVLLDAGRVGEAVTAFRAALEREPAAAAAHYNLGNALRAMGRHEDAAASYRRALELEPGLAAAQNNLCVALREAGRPQEAVESGLRAVALRPASAEAHNNAGLALEAAGRLAEAMESYGRALELRPAYAEAAYNLGNALRAARRPQEAIASYRQALGWRPAFPEAYHNLGLALEETGRLDEAAASHRESLSVRPDHPGTLASLGDVLRAAGRLEEAIAAYREALARDPDLPYGRSRLADALRNACDWEGFDELGQALLEDVESGRGAVTPFALLSWLDDPRAQLRCARHYVADWARLNARAAYPAPPPPLRLAYLSADFRDHPVAQLTAPLFELHDRSRFEVIGVSCGVDDGSALRRRVAAAFDRFLDVHGEDDASAAARIAAHGVHLLVDLSGHTRDARPGILARRPAPVLVSYLGYPGSLGGLADYILADHFVVPAAAEEHYAERVIHLPDSYFIHDGGRNLDAPAPTRVQCGLPPRGFVYCCFNRPFKITPDVFAVWMRLLERVPSSVLWLAEGSAVAAANLRQEARSRGVDPSRLVFAPRVAGLGDHLARHRVADLFLDTLPYNAHTTACDALAAGLPVLTCAGRSFASRVGASLLHAAGLPELVTSSLEAYESLALELAQEPVRLLELRERLARHRWQAPLFDTDRRRRQLEAAYTEMWRKWEAGEAPQGFALGAEAGG